MGANLWIPLFGGPEDPSFVFYAREAKHGLKRGIHPAPPYPHHIPWSPLWASWGNDGDKEGKGVHGMVWLH